MANAYLFLGFAKHKIFDLSVETVDFGAIVH